jgi:hypothetical protein
VHLERKHTRDDPRVAVHDRGGFFDRSGEHADTADRGVVWHRQNDCQRAFLA